METLQRPKLFNQTIEALTGMSITAIRSTPLCELRTTFEKRTGPMRVRGEGLMTRTEINRVVDDAIKMI